MNATPALADAEQKLIDVTANQAVHLWRFNIIRKALFIALDDNLIELALFKTSRTRRKNNDFIHFPNNADVAFAGNLQLLPELTKDLPNPMTEEEADAYKRDIGNLSDMIYQRENYFQESRAEVENEMDTHLKKWVKFGQASTSEGINSDANVLLSWLNDLKPVA